MITEDYVSFETAKLLKEKGFDEYCKSAYYVGSVYSVTSLGYIVEEKQNSDFGKYDNAISAPTLQMAMKWLREVHHIVIEVSPLSFTYKSSENSICNNWVFNLWKDCNPIVSEFYGNQTAYFTYEEACEAAIKYCLENLI